MSFKWYRSAGNANLITGNGGSGTSNIEVGQSGQPIYCYYTDVMLRLEAEVEIPAEVGVYRWRSTWRRQSGAPISGNPAFEHEITVTRDPSNQQLVFTAKGRVGPEESPLPGTVLIDDRPFVTDPGVQNSVGFRNGTYKATLVHAVQPQVNNTGSSIDEYEMSVAGIYKVTFDYRVGGDTPPLTSEVIGNVEYRVLAITNQAFDKSIFDPQLNTGETLTITADVNALPSGNWSPPGIAGAQPGLISWRVMIQQPLGATVRADQGSFIASSPDAAGKIGSISWTWDGKDEDGEYVTGFVAARIHIITPVTGGNTGSMNAAGYLVGEYPLEYDEEDRERRKLKDACGCDTGATTNYGDVQATSSLQSHFKGNSSMAINLTYQGVNSAFLPSSLGYGWAINRTDRVGTNANGDLVYISKDGRYERWTAEVIQGNLVFTPAHSDNKVRPYIDSNDLIYLFYPDRSQKVFAPVNFSNPNDPLSGLILFQSDKNGNPTHYSYENDGAGGVRLWAISDDSVSNSPSGRVTLIEYAGSAPQPIGLISGVVANNAFVGEQRFTQMLYHGATDAANYAVEDRLAQVRRYLVTGAESVYETETYLYYADPLEPHRFGKIYQILDARSNVAVEFDYYDEPQGRVATETVYGEMERAYIYDDVNNSRTVVSTDLTGKSVPATRQTVTFYDKYKNVIRSEVAVGPDVNVTTMEYHDPYNRYLMTRAVDPNLKTVERRYNERGNVIWSKDKDDNVTEVEYYQYDQDLVRLMKRPFVTVPDPGSPEGTTTRQYITEFVYDERSNLKKIIDPDLTGVPGAIGRATHFVIRNGVDDDSATDGQIAKVIDRRWDGFDPDTKDDYTTTFTYYPNGNLESIETPAGPGPHPARKVTFFYDNFDNVERATDLLGNEWNARFDALDRPLEKEDARGVSTYMAYSEGLLALVGSPSNLGPDGIQSNAVGFPQEVRITEFDYDDSSRLRKVIRQDSSSTTQDRVEYEYNGFSELIKLGRMINGHNKTNEWTYDQLGRAIELRDTLGRLTTRAYEPFCIGFEETTARGITKTSGFDALCRPILFSSTSEEHVRTYDELGRVVAIEQKEQARYSEDNVAPPVVRRRFGSARYYTPELVRGKVWNFEYDALDRVIKAKYPEGEEMSYQYGHEGELLRVVDADEKATRYEYNNDLSLRKVIIERGGNSVAEFLYSYDAAGRIREIHYPSASGIQVHFHDGGSPTISGWNENGQLTLMRYVKAREGAPGVFDLVRSFAYEYDDSGNRTSMVESNGVPAESVEWQYRYDWLDRLVQVRRGLGGVNPAVEREYVYDESDNRKYLDDFVNGKTFWYTYKTVVSGSETLYSDELAEILVAPSAGERNPGGFTSQETFVIDDDGNMTSRTTSQGTTTYDWDDLNNLLAVKRQNDEVTQNLYDAGSIRKEKLRDNEERIKSFNLGMSSASESSTVSNGNVSYLMGPQLMGFERNGNFFYFLSDVQGTVRDIVDSSGEVVQSYEFSEHGIPMQGSGAGLVASSKTYHGGLSVNDDIAESGLYMMGYRHYSAELGRFISRDPIGFRGGLNLFNGAGTSPVTFVDPSGLETSILITGEQIGTMTMPSGTCTGMYRAYVWQDGKQTGTFEVSRLPYDPPHPTEGRYRSYSEAPPGVYYVNPGPEAHRLELSDVLGGYSIQGPVDQRTNIQFHPAINAEGCITFRNTSVPWSAKNSKDPFWLFKTLINDDVMAGKAKVYIQGRANKKGSVDGPSGTVRDINIYLDFLSSPAVLNL